MSQPPPFESEVYDQLAGPGYVLFKDGLPPEPGTRDALNKLTYEPIPNAPNLRPGDGNRRQCKGVSAAVIRSAKSRLITFASEKDLLRGGKTVENVRSLWSGETPGYDVNQEERQKGDGPEHADAAKPESLQGGQVEDVPLSLIWAVEEGSRLRIHPIGGEWTIIQMRPGDVLVFRGDVCHNGLGYPKPNIRVHAYIDSPVIKRKPNYLFDGC